MPFDVIVTAVEGGIGEAATAFNAAELTGLDSVSAAAEAGITDANAFDFAQGPDGLLGSAIPGAGGDLGASGWYDVSYEQTFTGTDAQAALSDGGASVDSDIYNGATFSGDGGPGDLVNAETAVPVDVNNDLAESARLERFAENGLPTAQPSLVDQITGKTALFADQVKAAGANAVSSLTTQIQAEIPKLVAQAKQQLIGQAVGAVTGGVKSVVAKSLPGPLAAVANNVVDKAANNTASAFGATPIAPSVDLTGGGGGGGNGETGATFTGGGGTGNAEPVPFTNDAALANLANNIAAGTVATVVNTAKSVAADTGTVIGIDNIGNGIASARIVPTGITDPMQAAQAQAAAEQVAKIQLAQRQQSIAIQRKFEANNGDWRVKISLAPGSDYLYNDPTNQGDGTNGILWPLKQTGGVIFPYTPKITTSYNASYSRADLTHSNYTNYFYQGSSVGEIGISAKFTAQDTMEAQYLLAVIHFFRSATRMFYGQDAQRGAPPPLVFLTGFGEFQFQNHPCVVSSFSYDLPENVDYIRARSLNVNGMNMLTRRQTSIAVPGDPISGAYKRLADLFSGQGINKGAQSNSSPTALPSPPALGLNNPTYVPTSVDLSIRLYPVQSRSQVSQQFSVKKFANGQLIAGGFW